MLKSLKLLPFDGESSLVPFELRTSPTAVSPEIPLVGWKLLLLPSPSMQNGPVRLTGHAADARVALNPTSAKAIVTAEIYVFMFLIADLLLRPSTRGVLTRT